MVKEWEDVSDRIRYVAVYHKVLTRMYNGGVARVGRMVRSPQAAEPKGRQNEYYI